jgi:hypothetical protein
MPQKLKWNNFGCKFEYHCKVVTADNTGHGLLSTGNKKKTLPQYDKMPHLWQGLHGRVVATQSELLIIRYKNTETKL